MKKKILAMTVLAACMLFASCGKESDGQGIDTVQIMEDSGQAEPESGASGAGGQPEAENDSSGAGGQSEAGSDMPEAGNPSSEKSAADELALKEALAGEGGEEQTDIVLSDKLLKAGDTLEVLYPVDEHSLEQGLELTLQDAKLSASPEEAQLDRALMQEKTENYDLSGDPAMYGIDEAGILTCNLTIRNVNVEEGDDLHIGEFMIAYADPATGKVSILSSMPAYFSASSSSVGKSDYYHYELPKGESKEMVVAWLIPGEYEAENLYLCVTYDNREPGERQYFRLFGQE